MPWPSYADAYAGGGAPPIIPDETWHDVAFRIDLATGLLAREEQAGGEWDVHLWDDANYAIWGGYEWDWTDITDDYVRLTTRRGRAQAGGHYRTGTATIVLKNVDGIYSPSAPLSADINMVAGALIRIVAIHNGVEYTRFTGKVRSVSDPDLPGKVPLTTVSLVDAFADLTIDRAAVTPLGAGDLPGDRIDGLLDDANWPADLRSIGDGVETLQATGKDGSLLAELYLIADSEGGELFVSGEGHIVFADRATVDAAAAATEALTVAGYADPGGEGPWICWAKYTPHYSMDRVKNDVTIGRVGGTAQTEIDTDSINQYGHKTLVRSDLLNQSDTWPALMAERIVASRKDVVEQVVSVTLTAGDELATTAALGLELGTVIRTRRFKGVDPDDYEIDQLASIQNIEITAVPAGERDGDRRDEWTMKLATDSAAEVDDGGGDT